MKLTIIANCVPNKDPETLRDVKITKKSDRVIQDVVLIQFNTNSPEILLDMLEDEDIKSYVVVKHSCTPKPKPIIPHDKIEPGYYQATCGVQTVLVQVQWETKREFINKGIGRYMPGGELRPRESYQELKVILFGLSDRLSLKSFIFHKEVKYDGKGTNKQST